MAMMASEAGDSSKILRQIRGIELITRDTRVDPVGSSKPTIATTLRTDSSSHRTRLARAGDPIPIGITPSSGIKPNSTKETGQLQLRPPRRRHTLLCNASQIGATRPASHPYVPKSACSA
uniref:Uncharacterized protein n=1 Tax=Aegilops tauschii TaxID=37682 RepID=M8C1P1_AEGTA